MACLKDLEAVCCIIWLLCLHGDPVSVRGLVKLARSSCVPLRMSQHPLQACQLRSAQVGGLPLPVQGLVETIRGSFKHLHYRDSSGDSCCQRPSMLGLPCCDFMHNRHLQLQ